MFKIKTQVGNFILVSGDGRIRLVDEEYADTFKTLREVRKCIDRMVEWCGFDRADLVTVRA